MTESPVMQPAVLELCPSVVMHVRLRPFVHRFVYKVFCLRLRLDRPADLEHYNSWLFGIDRRRPVSFMSRDHGNRDGSNLMDWMNETLRSVGVEVEAGEVWLQCFPRMFGYVFNPVSFWFIHDRQGVLRVLLAEVNNTFGQRHQYVLTADGMDEIRPGQVLACKKVFHVSPFFPVSGGYRFQMTQTPSGLRMGVDFYDPSDDPTPTLRTAITAKPLVFSTASLLRAVLSRPMMTFGVMARIHWQAFKLWRQGATFHRSPALPEQDVTSNLRENP